MPSAASGPRADNEAEVLAALARVVAITRHERLRDLYRERPGDYGPAILAMDAAIASGTPPDRPHGARPRLAPDPVVAQIRSPGFDPAERARLLSRVSSCVRRGSTLPPSEQPACGCSELTLCRAGRGARPGRVTLDDCLACVASSP